MRSHRFGLFSIARLCIGDGVEVIQEIGDAASRSPDRTPPDSIYSEPNFNNIMKEISQDEMCAGNTWREIVGLRARFCVGYRGGLAKLDLRALYPCALAT